MAWLGATLVATSALAGTGGRAAGGIEYHAVESSADALAVGQAMTADPGNVTGASWVARPPEGLAVPPFVLAMGEGADIAARAGLPMVIGDLRDRERMRRGIDRYRAGFRPSVWAAEPYVVVSGTIAVADTPEEARRILLPEAWAMAHSRTHGTFPPLAPAEEVERRTMTAKERGFYEAGLTGQVYGTEEQVAYELESLSKETGAQELLVTTSTYDRAALLDSYTRLARIAGLG